MSSDPVAQTAPESTAQQLQAYTANLPALLQTTANQALPTGQTLQNANQTLAPQNQALMNQLLQQYAPGLYNTGNALNQAQLQGGINNASSNLAGAGGGLINQAIAADQQANPQYYAARQQAGSQLSNLLGSINLGGLTGSEQAQVERGLAQQDAQKGLLNAPSQTAAVSNAMNFGTALQAKQGLLSQAINTATSFLPSSQSGVNSFAIGSGQATNQANPTAQSSFLGVNNTPAQGATAANQPGASGLLSNIGNAANNAQNINANRRTTLDVANQTAGTVATGISSGSGYS